MRNNGREIQLQLDRILSVGIGSEVVAILPPLFDVGVGVTGAAFRAACSRAFGIRELGNARSQVIHRGLIKRKHASERAPFRSHVRDRHSR